MLSLVNSLLFAKRTALADIAKNSDPEIGDANFRYTLRTFKQQLALKM